MSSSSRLRFLFRSGDACSDGRETPFVEPPTSSSETSLESDSSTSESCCETDDNSSEFATDSESSSIGSGIGSLGRDDNVSFAEPFVFCFVAGLDYAIA
jgi:hypothetical protein